MKITLLKVWEFVSAIALASASLTYSTPQLAGGFRQALVDHAVDLLAVVARILALARLESYARVADFVGEPSEEATAVCLLCTAPSVYARILPVDFLL